MVVAHSVPHHPLYSLYDIGFSRHYIYPINQDMRVMNRSNHFAEVILFEKLLSVDIPVADIIQSLLANYALFIR